MESFFKKPAFKQMKKRLRASKKAFSKHAQKQLKGLRKIDLPDFKSHQNSSLAWFKNSHKKTKKHVSIFYRHAHNHWGKLMDWYEGRNHKQKLILFVVLALIVGALVKLGTDQLYPTGNEDNQLRQKHAVLNLNEIEKEQMQKSGPAPYENFPLCSL